ncbi:MAG: hypothetical protein MUC72_06740 [Acidobacteria bacterium]|jgi:hypothetical protein|nr:hypothetical protein [Acidobacteriota bacterium]
MKNKIMLRSLSLLLVAFLPALALSAEDEAEACWKKGVAAAALAQDHLPGKIYAKFEQLDGGGKAKSRNEIWLEWTPGDKEARLVKAVEDGKDVTRQELEKRRKMREKGREKNRGQAISVSAVDIHPLIASAGKPVAHKFLGREKRNGVDCNAYEFRKEYVRKIGEKERIVVHFGKIWLDAASGFAVEASYTYDPLPAMVKQLEMNTVFVAQGDKVFVKNHDIHVRAGFLFIKKRFRMNLVLDDYQEAAQEERQ